MFAHALLLHLSKEVIADYHFLTEIQQSPVAYVTKLIIWYHYRAGAAWIAEAV